MQSKALTPEDYIAELPQDRVVAFKQLRQTILKNLPKGFEETMSYGMIGYVVPHKIYPAGYHANPDLPLPFINIASQKNHIALYHAAIYANPTLKNWFVEQYSKHSKYKLDMGKSCIRFKKVDAIPFQLIALLSAKVTVDEWIELYENALH